MIGAILIKTVPAITIRSASRGVPLVTRDEPTREAIADLAGMVDIEAVKPFSWIDRFPRLGLVATDAVADRAAALALGPVAAAEAVQRLVTNDVGKLVDGQAMYTVMCYPDGGIVDDCIVYRGAADDYNDFLARRPDAGGGALAQARTGSRPVYFRGAGFVVERLSSKTNEIILGTQSCGNPCEETI